MQTINSLDKLIEALDAATKKDVPKILGEVELTKEELNKWATWTKDDYTRNCVKRTNSYELILLCWEAQAVTPIHDHGGQDCWVYQAAGNLTEIRYEKDDNGHLIETKRMELKPKAVTYMEDKMGYHQLCNLQNSRGYTLHLYASPIDECAVFNETKQCFETKEMSYDTFEGVPPEVV